MVSRKRKTAEKLSNQRGSEQVGRRAVRPIGSWVNQLLARRGYAQVNANEAMTLIVSNVVGDGLREEFQLGNLKSGKLQIYASDSVILQELNFRKRVILAAIQKSFPDSKVSDLRFRIQAK